MADAIEAQEQHDAESADRHHAANDYQRAVYGMSQAALEFVAFCCRNPNAPAPESAAATQRLLCAALTYTRAHDAYHGEPGFS